MATREVKRPTAQHPITITSTEGRVRVRINGQLVADTRAALGLQEANYPAVHYIPVTDVDPKVLSRSRSRSYCPYKGDAGYYDVTVGNLAVEDASWTYEKPYPAVAAIAGHVAFYPNKADITVDPT